MNMAVKEQRKGTVVHILNGSDITGRLAEKGTGGLWGNVRVHESRWEPDMLGCGASSLWRYEV